MRTSDYLDRLRSALDLPSDYALQKPLNVSKGAISLYRNNKSFFDDEVAIRVGELLGLPHPAMVVLDMHIERAKTDETKRLWEDVLEGFHLPSPRANVSRRTLRA